MSLGPCRPLPAATGHLVGYDPEGNGNHGIALLRVVKGVPQHLDTHTLESAEAVILFLAQQARPARPGNRHLDLLEHRQECLATGRSLVASAIPGSSGQRTKPQWTLRVDGAEWPRGRLRTAQAYAFDTAYRDASKSTSLALVERTVRVQRITGPRWTTGWPADLTLPWKRTARTGGMRQFPFLPPARG